jgi:hypothetical protein
MILYIRFMHFQYHPGTIPIILTSPHGGWITPDIIEDRMPGCPTADGNCVFEKDEVSRVCWFKLVNMTMQNHICRVVPTRIYVA